MLAALYADLGRLDEAVEQLDAFATDNFAVIPRDWGFPLAIRYLAETCAQLGDRRRAARLLPAVEPYRGQVLVATLGTSIEAAADRSLGQLYGLVGPPDDANQHFQSAYCLETSMGFAPLAARTATGMPGSWYKQPMPMTTAKGSAISPRHKRPLPHSGWPSLSARQKNCDTSLLTLTAIQPPSVQSSRDRLALRISDVRRRRTCFAAHITCS
jgi:hypothetical protein